MRRTEHMRFLSLLTALLAWAGSAQAYSPQMRQALMGGPWDLTVQTLDGGTAVRFPITVEDENQAAPLEQNLPVLGSPLKIRLKQYLPSLAWDTQLVKQPDGGPAARLQVRGPNVDSTIWLSAADPGRRAANSSIGGVLLKGIADSNSFESLLRRLQDPDTVGLVTVRLPDRAEPLDAAVAPGDTIDIPDSPWRLEVLAYYPHYSVDTLTGKVANKSSQAVNPALHVRLRGPDGSRQRWVWSRFPDGPHELDSMPVKLEFTDFDIADLPGRHIILAAQGHEPRIFFAQDKRVHAEKLDADRSYAFARPAYTFTVAEYADSAVLQDTWRNAADRLTRPAVVVEVTENDRTEELVLALNSPAEFQSAAGAVQLLLGKRDPLPGHGRVDDEFHGRTR